MAQYYIVVPMLIDEFLPAYDVVERHSTIVRASAAATYSAIRTADIAGAAPVKLMLAIRKLPAALVSGRTGLSALRDRARDRIALGDFEKSGFTVLAEDPPRELLIGLVGAFWTPSGGLCDTNPDHFRGPQLAGTARAAWNFVVGDAGDGRVRLTTETRVQTADEASRRRFRLYWLFVRPGSGLIRRYMLHAIKREAERASPSNLLP